MLPPVKHKVAVYGSLKAGFYNHNGYLKNEKAIGTMWIKNLAMRAYTAFPAVFQIDDPQSKVYVEIYEVGDDTLRYLDSLEGHPNFYRRISISLAQFGDGFIYIQDAPKEGEEFDWVYDGFWVQTRESSVGLRVKRASIYKGEFVEYIKATDGTTLNTLPSYREKPHYNRPPVVHQPTPLPPKIVTVNPIDALWPFVGMACAENVIELPKNETKEAG